MENDPTASSQVCDDFLVCVAAVLMQQRRQRRRQGQLHVHP